MHCKYGGFKPSKQDNSLVDKLLEALKPKETLKENKIKQLNKRIKKIEQQITTMELQPFSEVLIKELININNSLIKIIKEENNG